MPNGSTIACSVDHIDTVLNYKIKIGNDDLGWMEIGDLNNIKKIINKAIKIKKQG